MVTMFAHTHFFNQDLSKWDVSRVTDMRWMFCYAKSFNQDLSKWDVSRVTNMDWMFSEARSFQQTLCGAAWVDSTASKNNMFDGSSGSISMTACGAWVRALVVRFITFFLHFFYTHAWAHRLYLHIKNAQTRSYAHPRTLPSPIGVCFVCGSRILPRQSHLSITTANTGTLSSIP